MTTAPTIRSLVGVALNAAVDRIVAVDRLQPGAIHRPTVLSELPGGKAANTARAAGSLGLPARVVAVLAGHAGQWYADAMHDLGIELSAVEVDGETRTCLSVLDRSTNELTEFYEPGVTVPKSAWPRVESALESALRPTPDGRASDCLVVLSGSLPPGVPDDAYRRLGEVCRQVGAPWLVDVAGSPLLAALEAGPWLVKVNEHEARATADGMWPGGDLAQLAAWLADRSAGNVLLTRGRDGTILHTAGGTWSYGRPPVGGPFAVGSGDALVAGLAVALARGQPLPDAVRFGSAVAAANALEPGQGVFDASRLDEIAVAIEVTAGPEQENG